MISLRARAFRTERSHAQRVPSPLASPPEVRRTCVICVINPLFPQVDTLICVTVQLGAARKPQKRLQEALVKETEAQWKPQVKARARQRAVTSGGLVISCRAFFGFGPEGSSDAGRVRDIMTAVSPMHADLILAARESGATDDELHELVAEAIADAYFRREGGGRTGLHVEFKDIERLDISF